MTSRRAGPGALVLLALSASLFAQSQAANGTIEGVVRDTTGAVLSGVTVTVVNLETGALRSRLTDDTGTYRALLLPLGPYRVKLELTGFKAVERTGITLSAGQTAVINVTLEVGGVAEVVSVSGAAPVSEPGKVDLGRTISEAEVKNLPLVSRNPYNFALLQPNVTGFENDEFGVPRINANGTQMRTNYMLDGNTNTQKDRAGLRLLPTSEIVVREVRVVTSGFAPEFGQTTGMVYNAVTPSGSNEVSGSASFRFRRKDFSSRPFFLSPTAQKPDTFVNNWTGTVGGPILKDRWHFYLGGEYIDRDLSADRVITVSRATADRLGLPPSAVPDSGVMPTRQHTTFLIGKSDYQLDPANKLSA
ncbi:MAG TPA: carboxypeptidase-like regulatory domain-containing protein, partial [Vicinamibacteria bacterium]|nr:carboxypeptidase-like regulatory domain-containing protein [Vicinamibacteria bacterium]